MTIKKSNEFVIVRKRKIDTIAKKLREKGGMILIINPHYFSSPRDVLTGKVTIHLFEDCRIEKGSVINGHTADKNPGQNREYTLRKIPPSSGNLQWDLIRTWFRHLVLGSTYWFEISRQHTISCGADNPRDIVLFIPKSHSPAAAIRYGLEIATKRINKQNEKDGSEKFRFRPAHIKRIITYILGDLKTQKVVNHNTRAGMDADIATGLD